jgi:hypothetical protein
MELAVESEMPVEKAVDIMWLQPQTEVGWAWKCPPSDVLETQPGVAPPLYFWFIPLASRTDRQALSVSRGRTERHEGEAGSHWVFEWQISNRGRKPLPLKINVWSPIGAVPCAAIS